MADYNSKSKTPNFNIKGRRLSKHSNELGEMSEDQPKSNISVEMEF